MQREQILSNYPEWRVREDIPLEVKDVSSFALHSLTTREKEIIHHDATGLVEMLRLGHYSALEVTIAYCKVGYSIQHLIRFHSFTFLLGSNGSPGLDQVCKLPSVKIDDIFLTVYSLKLPDRGSI